MPKNTGPVFALFDHSHTLSTQPLVVFFFKQKTAYEMNE